MKTHEPTTLPFSTHLCLLLILLIHVYLTQVQARIAFQQSCSSSCGDIQNISYPFRLNTDPPGCGDTDYQLSCENNLTLLEFHSGKYYVKQISYDKRIIRVVDVNLASGSCNLPYKSVSVDEMISDSRYKGKVLNTYTSFIRCSSNISNQAYRSLPCLNGNGSYVYASYDTYIISDLQGSCSFLSRVPTIYQAVLYPSYDSILKLMQSGFDLGWSVECRDCVASGSLCSLRSWDAPYVYHCYRAGIHIPSQILAIISAIWTVLLGINLVARFVLAPIVIIAFLVHKYRRGKKPLNNKGNLQLNPQSLMPRRYSYAHIVAITNDFKDKLGQGGFGTVYKGQLPDSSYVAVKMLSNSKIKDGDFTSEVSMLGRIHHVNIVQLVGFCLEGSHRALLYEYMPNGSLTKYIFPREPRLQPFTWEKILQIALGTAQGIQHLHGGFSVSIIHFDIKPQNILLDENFIPKVSDFGLARFFQRGADFMSTDAAQGTMAYVAPEIVSGRLKKVSCKSDVYSFGMLLLEMVERRRVLDGKESSTSETYFPSWVYNCLNERGDLELENVPEIETAMMKLCVVGLWCIQKKAVERPLMTKVVEMLEGDANSLKLPLNSISVPQCFTSEQYESDSSTELLISEQ
ncbi:hypothetical protein K2173_000216 [Erythroxylum novogranatense]|uniref:Protein kinase domain-containing protein n=1 Tax=Erythroxylum novogranatense TaxID=1862640 RepID=A0AAV8SWK2_9ROSI|nr:hypothetical protein K2173_000216 [Erythroxylum novogranatense]